MLTQFRRRLGKLKNQLERKVETMHGGKPRVALQPISAADKNLMLEWFTGKVDDQAVIARARSEPGGRDLIERACAARPANARVWAARAEFSLEDDDLEAALEQAKHAQGLGPLEAEVALVLVRVSIAAGRRDEALAVLPGALENARRTLSHATRLELCRQWRELEPESVEPLLESARVRIAAGDLDTATAELEQLRGRFGARVDILLLLAAVYQDLVRTEDALQATLQAVEASPLNVDALCMAGACARDLGSVEMADGHLSRALSLDPASPFVQYNLGLLRLQQGRIDEAAGLLLGARALSRGEPWTVETFEARLAFPVDRNVADSEWASARFKLAHDIEQFEYLRDNGNFGTALDPLIAQYQAALGDPLLPKDASRMVALDPLRYPLLARTYKAPLHTPDAEPPQAPLLNPANDWDRIEQAYFDAGPGLVVIDDLLSAPALDALRTYCLESTVWNDLRRGYLGAYMADGFSSRLLMRIALELRAVLPRVIGAHAVQTMWGYKYDSKHAGMDVHADAAAVNVNFWTTPDEANLDPGSGGLVVHLEDPTRDPNFRRFNATPDAIRAHLESVGAKNVKIPYRANRAVLFNSNLFHETDAFRFNEGYENRRVNVTMLYGTKAG